MAAREYKLPESTLYIADVTGPHSTDEPYVLLACAGLDHARRGFETFARECFEALRGEAGIRIELAKGSGPSGPGERAIPALRRDAKLPQALARMLGARSFRLEHLAFAFSLQPLLARRRPDVVYLSEWDTARGLAALRSVTRQRFKLVLSNGTFAASGFEHLDHVQELTPGGREFVLARGADPARHTVLPLGFEMSARPELPSQDDRLRLRERLSLPRDRAVVVSVAALNRSHKRLDYLIEEVASLPAPRPFLLMLGEPDDETPELRDLARERLGDAGHGFRTVPADAVADHLHASDLFVLASLAEMQGRALIEAMACGLPCLAHDYSVARFALGEHGVYADLSRRGELAPRLLQELGAGRDGAAAHARHRFVYERFSWDRLRPRYVEFLGAVAKRTVSSSSGDAVSR